MGKRNDGGIKKDKIQNEYKAADTDVNRSIDTNKPSTKAIKGNKNNKVPPKG